jgi:hypothetical protein
LNELLNRKINETNLIKKNKHTNKLLRSLLSDVSRFRHRLIKSTNSSLKCELGRVGGGYLKDSN